MINLFKVKMSPDAGDAVTKVLNSGFIGQGEKVEDFEMNLWHELQSKTRPVTVNSATSAIDLALELIGVGPGDEVISTPMTCFATQVGAIHRHAVIKWADVDPITGLISPESVERLITNKTKAILAVDWIGRFPDYAALKSFGVPVIEDAAHVWDVFLAPDEKPERGDYIVYSFQAIKFLTTGDGGALITPPEKEEQARLLRWYGLDRNDTKAFRFEQDIAHAGFKYHMNDIAAKIGSTNINGAAESVSAHRRNAQLLASALKHLPYADIPPFDLTCSYWVFPVLLNSHDRNKFIEYLAAQGIEASPAHARNDFHSALKEFAPIVGEPLRGVNSFSNRQVNIPCGWWLTDDDINKIIGAMYRYKPWA